MLGDSSPLPVTLRPSALGSRGRSVRWSSTSRCSAAWRPSRPGRAGRKRRQRWGRVGGERRRQDGCPPCSGKTREADAQTTTPGTVSLHLPPFPAPPRLLSNDPGCELASPTESDLLSPLLLVSPTLHLSPPPSPPPKPQPEMGFKVRPFTHPGYLFGNFPPTAKKVQCGVMGAV